MNNVDSDRLTGGDWSNWLKRGLLVLVVALLLWLNRDHLSSLLAFLNNRAAITAFLQPFGLWGPLLYLLILMTQVLTAMIPGQVLLIAGGYLYGFGWGVLLNAIGAIGASQLAFGLARRWGQPVVNRMVPAHILNRWHKVTARQGFFFFLLCFWLPLFPDNALNYIAGLSPMPFWLFLLANLLGRLPNLTLMTLIGSHGLELTWQQWVALGIIGLVFIVGGRLIAPRIENYFRNEV